MAPPVNNLHSRHLWAALFVSLIGFGCGQSASPPPATSLAAVRIPKNADLSGIRGVDVRLGSMMASGRVDLLRSDGRIVFSGHLEAGRPFVARIAMPTKDSTLTAVLHTYAGPDRSVSLAISADTARGSF
jgi:hypothetical protein